MSRKSLRVADYLEHVLKAVERIERYMSDVDFDAFVESEMTQDAVIRNLEVIGEACRNIERVDPDFAAKHPDLPLRSAKEMRNVLTHGYFGVDLAVVWRTVRTNLPVLKAQVRKASPRSGAD
ncbi:DUF86 domain-containing protein [soil metagenome]